MLSLRTNFDASRADGIDLRLALRCGDDTFVAVVTDGELTIERSEPADGVTTVAGDPPMIASVVYGGRPVAAAVADGDLVITGEPGDVERFVALFTLPPVATRR